MVESKTTIFFSHQVAAPLGPRGERKAQVLLSHGQDLKNKKGAW